MSAVPSICCFPASTQLLTGNLEFFTGILNLNLELFIYHYLKT